jgi:glycosyltransferase involved in cell wall biosynthesis
MAKVLHSITGLNVGGAEIMLARFLGRSDGKLYPPGVLTLMKPGAIAKNIEALGLEVETLGMAESSIKLKDFRELRRMMVKTKPDLVHGWMYHGNAAASIGSLISLRFVPVIWSIHHSVSDIAAEKPMTRRIIRLLARLSRRTAMISYCSKISADQHEALGFDASKRRVIPNGIDCAVFKPSSESRSKLQRLLGVPENRQIIGNVARFHPMKDQANFVRAAAELLRKGMDVQGLIIGSGHEEDGPVRRTARELGIAERITILGARDDIPALLPGLDAYCLSSAWGEAFPLAVTEAMACGTPAVVTDVGDCGWLVGDTGKVVRPNDKDALAGGLAELLALAPESRRELGLKARQRVIENFSLEHYVSSHEALYREALESRRR